MGTKIAGFTCVYCGDDRFYNNIFIGKEGLDGVGTSYYKNYTTSLEEYIEKVNKKNGDHEVFQLVEQPVYINNNAYFNGAEPFEKENCNLVDKSFNQNVCIIEEGEEVYLSCELPETFENTLGESDILSPLIEVGAS